MKKAAGMMGFLVLAELLQAASVNRPAPTFALMNTQFETRTLSSYKGKVLFINFWASWCAPCQNELPELNRLAADYGKAVKVLAINVDRQRDPAKALLTKLGLARPRMEILWDTQSRVVGVYDVNAMPSSFIVDAKGVIRFTHSGFHSHDPETWRQEINQLISKRS